MAMKSSILIPLLVVFVGTQAEAQLPPLLPPVSVGTLFNISGIVSCSVNASVNGSNILTPPFRNASVELSCGGNVIATATTNESGVFVILARRGAMLSTLLSTCKVNVVTPLSACNANLPSTIPSLEASLRLVQNTLNGTIFLSAGPFNITGSL